MFRGIVLTISSLFWICTSTCPAQSLGERDTDFEIGLAQSTEKPAGMVAHVTTSKTYPCEGYTLRTQTRWNRDTVSVYILGLLRPSPCYQTSSEATGSVFLGDMKGSVWFLRIRYRGDVDLYKMVHIRKRLSAIAIYSTFTTVNLLPAE